MRDDDRTWMQLTLHAASALPIISHLIWKQMHGSRALTIVGEAGFAQTHDKVHFHLVGSYRFGANWALET